MLIMKKLIFHIGMLLHLTVLISCSKHLFSILLLLVIIIHVFFCNVLYQNNSLTVNSLRTLKYDKYIIKF